MAGEWGLLYEFENDIDKLLDKMKEDMDESSREGRKVIASIADERGELAKGVIFYSKPDSQLKRLNNTTWVVSTVETKAGGSNQYEYKEKLFIPIQDMLNGLPSESAFAAKIFLTDCADGTATASLYYPTKWAEGKDEPAGPWEYTYYFNNRLSSVLSDLANRLNTNVPDFSLAAVADEDGHDAKNVVFRKRGLSTSKLYRGQEWKYRVYRTRADGNDEKAYSAELFDKIVSDLRLILTDDQARAAQIFFTDRTRGNATISIFYPERVIISE
ncbi:hypothetical protein BHU62_00405 [Serratia marcescens]|uniref:Uncharacterized protein n=1 Tax=Serratia marcescens TaxID=615 RepID=A0A1Q4P603_SERMA|nr:hypothetical protein [Serratia marcescens]OKB68542.1 hypothetical protein BHU62_00405 [Serratia marcescens]